MRHLKERGRKDSRSKDWEVLRDEQLGLDFRQWGDMERCFGDVTNVHFKRALLWI